MEQEHRIELHRILSQRFIEDEFRTLCFYLGVSYDNLSGEGLSGKARELLIYCEHREQIPELIATGKRLRPDISWPDAPIPPKLQLPHNLPLGSIFVGRVAEKAHIYESFHSVRLVCIDGIGGIGKTALALEVAYEFLNLSQADYSTSGTVTFDGFIWIPVEGRELTLDALLNTVARGLGYPGIAHNPIEEKEAVIRELLRTKPYLLVVDNLDKDADASVLDFLNKLPEPSRALITTRTPSSLEARAISLKHLTEPESLKLIRSEGKRLGSVSVEQTKDQVLLCLCQATGGIPLAIKWAVGQIKQRGQSLNTVLDALYGSKSDIFKVFDYSWKLLSDDAQRVLMVMPIFSTSASRTGIKEASNMHSSALDKALDQLVEMSLVHETGGPEQIRYSIHTLTRFFVTAKCESKKTFVQSAFERVLEYYKQLVTPPKEVQVGTLYWDGISNHAESENIQKEWDNLDRLIRWALNPDPETVEPEWRGLAQLIVWPSDSDRDQIALDLFVPLVHFLNAWGLWNERSELSREMCQVANRLGDSVEAWLWIDAIGFLASERRRWAEFKEALEKGRKIAHDFNLVDALILANAFEAWIYARRSRRNINLARKAQEKIDSVLKTIDLDLVSEYSKVRRIVVARAIGPQAILHSSQENYDEARESLELELELRRSVGENPTRMLSRLASLCLKQKDVLSAEKFLAQVSSPRPRDLAGLNYARALVAEQKSEVQKALELAELALEQHRRFDYVRGEGRYKRLLRRLRKRIAEITDHEE
jgi:tetratricopeptide (TPR) repeat protein